MTTVLVDGDIVAYRCAASCMSKGVTNAPPEIAQLRVNELMYRIIQETEATKYKVYIGGEDNFRKQIYPAYKANRKDTVKPEHLECCREQLVVEWGAEVVNGMETDDRLGIEQREDTIIASIDKDLLMIPGRHYNFVKNEFYDVDELAGLRHFWFQMIMGDRSDNIPGYDGVMRITVPKFLKPVVDSLLELEDEAAMEAFVKDLYTDKDQFEINKDLIYILQSETEHPDYLSTLGGN